MSISSSKLLTYERLLVLLRAQKYLAGQVVLDGKAKSSTIAQYEALNKAFDDVIKAEAKYLIKP